MIFLYAEYIQPPIPWWQRLFGRRYRDGGHFVLHFGDRDLASRYEFVTDELPRAPTPTLVAGVVAAGAVRALDRSGLLAARP